MAFYWYCMSYMRGDSGNRIPFLLYMSGIIQGCSLSGSIFASAMDPSSRMMIHELNLASGRSLMTFVAFVVKACADDIGASLARLSLLKALYMLFILAQWGAGPTLKPKKCKLIISYVFTPKVAIRVKDFIAEHCPS